MWQLKTYSKYSWTKEEILNRAKCHWYLKYHGLRVKKLTLQLKKLHKVIHMIEKRKCFPNNFNIILVQKSETEILEEGGLGVGFTHEHSNEYHKQSARGLKTKCITTKLSLDSILKSRDITLPIKFCLVKAMVFPVVMYGCDSWTLMLGKIEGWKRRGWLFVTPWTAACQASLSITKLCPLPCPSLNSMNLSLLKLKSIKSVMPSNYLILCHPLEYSGLISFKTHYKIIVFKTRWYLWKQRKTIKTKKHKIEIFIDYTTLK